MSSMLHHPNYLALCSELRQAGLQLPLDQGVRLGRGYADLGYEEFTLLPGRKLLSLMQGTSSTLPEEHLHHFFWIPSCDELVGEIDRRGWDLVKVELIDRRAWVIEACSDDGSQPCTVSSPYVIDGLAQLLRNILQSSKVSPL